MPFKFNRRRQINVIMRLSVNRRDRGALRCMKYVLFSPGKKYAHPHPHPHPIQYSISPFFLVLFSIHTRTLYSQKRRGTTVCMIDYLYPMNKILI